MQTIKLYIAGKVNPNSSVGKLEWRDALCEELQKRTGIKIINLDPTRYGEWFDENDPKLVFGRDAYMIKSADIVIVNLTDDISVGGSQEMLIAKYLGKPLIGHAQRGGKFNKDEKIVQGKVFKNYIAAFVAIPCDFIAENIQEIANHIKNIVDSPDRKPKSMQIIDDSINYYQQNFLDQDDFRHKVHKSVPKK